MTYSKSQQFTIGSIDKVFDFYKPRMPLSRFVDSMWICKGNQSRHKPDRILPTGTIELAINLKQDELRFFEVDHLKTPARFSAAVMSGASSRGFVPDPDDEVFIIGAHFKPGGAYPFLGMPAGDITNKHVDLRELWGGSSDGLRERLCEADSHSERFRLLEESLMERLRGDWENHYAVMAALEMFSTCTNGPRVREAAATLRLSQRRFIQVFKDEVGITPKLYSRIRRFQETRSAIRPDSAVEWATLALEHGYCDQSHLIREFAEFTGRSPMEYMERYARSLIPRG